MKVPLLSIKGLLVVTPLFLAGCYTQVGVVREASVREYDSPSYEEPAYSEAPADTTQPADSAEEYQDARNRFYDDYYYPGYNTVIAGWGNWRPFVYYPIDPFWDYWYYYPTYTPGWWYPYYGTSYGTSYGHSYGHKYSGGSGVRSHGGTRTFGNTQGGGSVVRSGGGEVGRRLSDDPSLPVGMRNAGASGRASTPAVRPHATTVRRSEAARKSGGTVRRAAPARRSTDGPASGNRPPRTAPTPRSSGGGERSYTPPPSSPPPSSSGNGGTRSGGESRNGGQSSGGRRR
jgi:hypothetical protein